MHDHLMPLSVLDLAPIAEGFDAAQSFRNSLSLAQHAERLGYRRFWLAEHHGMPGIASAATSVLIGHVAGGTKTIRVGAGGIMLPNHSPLVIAEQFGTLEALYPAASTWAWAARPAPTRSRLARCAAPADRPDEFPRDVVELMDFLSDEPRQSVRAVPGAGEGAGLDPGLQPVRRAAGGDAGPAVCVRLALRAAADDGGHRGLPRHLQAVGAAGQAVRDAGLQRGRGRHR
jgi:alkanesulfonate monooxygenase SsuD/methylene tetrahydromethanopterin reductase-like flavin-dependent oxidoreductase (luciferase family)